MGKNAHRMACEREESAVRTGLAAMRGGRHATRNNTARVGIVRASAVAA
jgi:hypothetical protein